MNLPKVSVSVRIETEAWQCDFRALALTGCTSLRARLNKMLEEKMG